MPLPKAVQQYLQRYAAAEARQVAEALAGPLTDDGRTGDSLTDNLSAPTPKPYQHICAIPAFDEPPDFVRGLVPANRGLSPGCRWLAVVVVNATEHASQSAHRRNQELIDSARTGGVRLPTGGRHDDGPPMWLMTDVDAQTGGGCLDVLVVDRASPGVRFPPDQGVGLARRIGCDIALALRARGAVGSRWIHLTDADAALPTDYFCAADRAPETARILTYPFWHDTAHAEVSDAIAIATALYEVYLRYHVLGLRYAGSPYAAHTIGSALAVDAWSYAAVRGVPLRRAGEDFYLVGKVAKLGPLCRSIARARSGPILLQARASTRVPFGTGMASQHIAEHWQAHQQYPVYHPRIYLSLRLWLSALADLVHAHDGAALARPERAVSEALARTADRMRGASIGDIAADEQRQVHDVVQELGVVRALEETWRQTSRQASSKTGRQASGAEARLRRLHGWFDNFRSLKFIHALRARAFPSIPWPAAFAEAPFVADAADAARDAVQADPARPDEVRLRLRELRRQLAACENDG